MNALIAAKNRKLPCAFIAVWFLANLVLIWLLAVGQVSFAFDSIWIVVLVLLPCIVILMRLVRNPIDDEPVIRKTHKGKLFGQVAVVIITLLLLQGVLGKFILFILPISIVCLYYDLETAIGFHFWMDFLKFAFALFLFNR